ncbi:MULTISPECIES: hypothetical protein [Pseudonocardia]|uniref:C2H2-type domain-containing protein n=1 Tax=Pseudonocardia abyssalis TaxID=2792008 RepID=A0ABS6V1U3_9PSEU|nr:hypothetical protein [Pseudonocardia abyssalis]MBW0119234.1 hypothetical protein [Pseudonocardia abyssalis]MBW0138435.1 hypothetical protein [Pseudonocardia abyssalis]
MPIHITLTRKTRIDDPTDVLGRTYFGWDPDATAETNWAANRGHWVLGQRARGERYVLFSFVDDREIVMAAEIDDIVEATDKPGKKIIEGALLQPGHPVYEAFVGQPQPESARVRNPVTYLDVTVGGWLCGCGCGAEIYVGEFVRGHEQTALHQRVARIGTIPEFIRWFDTLEAGQSPETTRATAIAVEGRLELSVTAKGATTLRFTPVPA